MTRGFSLLEVIIVMALLAIVFSLGALFSTSAIARANALSERDLFVSLLTATRAKALANIDESPQSLYIDTNDFVTYEGTTYSAGNATNRRISKVSKAGISGQQTFTFAQLSGDALSGIGTTTIDGGAQKYTVNINTVGRIDW